jgi:hypothetical protein
MRTRADGPPASKAIFDLPSDPLRAFLYKETAIVGAVRPNTFCLADDATCSLRAKNATTSSDQTIIPTSVAAEHNNSAAIPFSLNSKGPRTIIPETRLINVVAMTKDETRRIEANVASSRDGLIS